MKLTNFTAFSEASFPFSRDLNVIVGINGTGKSHVLKMAYALLYVSARGAKDSGSPTPTKTYLQGALARKLVGVFRPDELGRLASRRHGRTQCIISADFGPPSGGTEFSFGTNSTSEVVTTAVPRSWEELTPVFLPTRELMTIYPGFVSLYETTALPFEETWRDTCLLLGAPLTRGPREAAVRSLLVPVEEAMGGSVILDADRFYLRTSSGKMEMHLVAEGLRKLAMVARLLANGTLLDKGYLFWDEPEANLNPKLVKGVARTIMQLSAKGIQVFIATHSLFLLKELSILQESGEFRSLDVGYFGLTTEESGSVVECGGKLEDLSDIAALDEELAQSDRYLELSQ